MRALLLAGASALLFTVSINAENWPQWRGPFLNGSTTEKNLPATFSKTENVKWCAPLPGPAAATPIVWNDHVFVSTTDQSNRTTRALCFDRKSGKVIWDEQVSSSYGYGDSSNFASPSPVTDGQVVVFLYGNGDLAAFDFAGKKIWSRNLQKDYGGLAYNWTYGASPLLYDGKLFVAVLQRNEPVHGRGRTDGPIDSYLLAMEPQTGKTLWKHARPCDARAESHEAYSTPIPFTYDGRTELLVIGGDCITGHSPKDGEEFWRWATWNPTKITHWRLVPSVVTGGNVLLASAPKGSPIYAFKPGGKGQLEDSWIAWKSQERDVSTDVATPLFYQGRFYVLNGERRTISRVDPATGKADWIGDLESRIKIEASPIGADGKIYFQNFRGEVFVVAAAEQFRLLHKAAMGDEEDDQIRATIAAAQGNLFIRTLHKLYCIGQ
jgi:outer membrane protein assembly factor BamB